MRYHLYYVGIITFAYIINEIGSALSSLQNKRMVLERDLMTMEKIRTHYKINKDLLEKSRNYLIAQNKDPDFQLLPEE